MPQALNAKGRPAEPGDAEYSWDLPYEDQGAKLLGEARYTLGRGREFMKEAHDAGDAAVEFSNRTHRANMPATGRDITNYTDLGSALSGAAAIAPTPASPALMLASGVLGLPGGVRRMINPDEDESSGAGMMQTGMSLAGLAPALGGFARAGKIAQQTSPEIRAMGSKLAPTYGGVGRNSGNIGEDILDLVGGRGGRTDDVISPELEKMIQAGSDELPASWKQFASLKQPQVAAPRPRPSRARAVPTKETVRDMLTRMNQEAESGARNVFHTPSPGSKTAEMLDALPPSGMDTITPAEWEKLGLRQVRQTSPTYRAPRAAAESVAAPVQAIDDGANWGDDLLAQMTGRERRLSIPAHSRAYRANTVVE